jgi:hypothetical protein
MRTASDSDRVPKVNPLRLCLIPGAAFGATLYRALVLFGATGCYVDNESKLFILLSLFGLVQCSAGKCFRRQKRT